MGPFSPREKDRMRAVFCAAWPSPRPSRPHPHSDRNRDSHLLPLSQSERDRARARIGSPPPPLPPSGGGEGGGGRPPPPPPPPAGGGGADARLGAHSFTLGEKRHALFGGRISNCFFPSSCRLDNQAFGRTADFGRKALMTSSWVSMYGPPMRSMQYGTAANTPASVSLICLGWPGRLSPGY